MRKYAQVQYNMIYACPKHNYQQTKNTSAKLFFIQYDFHSMCVLIIFEKITVMLVLPDVFISAGIFYKIYIKKGLQITLLRYIIDKTKHQMTAASCK